jgi:hypothetical protein
MLPQLDLTFSTLPELEGGAGAGAGAGLGVSLGLSVVLGLDAGLDADEVGAAAWKF